jgi:polyisoprenoid-binding protein YceI
MFARKWRWLLITIVVGLICLFGIPFVFSLLPRDTLQNASIQSLNAEIIAVAPTAPVLDVAGEDQFIYRIDPAQSEARYAVQEVILNTAEGRRVIGTTQLIRGDVLIDLNVPASSQVGEIIIDAQSLTSDSTLRDQRLRADYLQSERYPEVRFIAEQITGLPETIQIGTRYTAEIEGVLTIKETSARVTWDANLTLESDRLVGSASTEIRMSTFEVGPINLIGWLQTEDVMQLQFDFVALPVEGINIAAAPVRDGTPVQPAPYSGEGVEFYRDVRPILEASCVGCHTTGQIGFPVYPLVTVQDAVNVADDLAFVVQSGYMPPWFAGPAMPPLQHDPSLSDSQIATLVEWAAAGAPVAGALDTPLQATASTGVEIRHDLVLEMPIAYQAPEGITDDYRCFLLDPMLDSQRYITGYEVIPGSVSIVHHVLVFPVPAEAREAAEAKSNLDGRPGWECFGGAGLPGMETNTAIAPGWVPGSGANQYPENTGILLQPGDLFVFQVHYNLEGGSIPDQSTLILELSEPDADLIALQGIGLAAPVELPCPEAYHATEPCQRAFAIRDAETRDSSAGWLADALLIMCDRTVDDYANQDAARIESVCDSTAPISGQAIQVNGHMHRLGTSNRIELNPDTPNAQILLDIPNWDFDWQQNYTFVEPIRIEAGDVLRITCTWDNTRGIQLADVGSESTVGWQADFRSIFGVNRVLAHDEILTQPYQYVTWGEGTRDEMCLSAVIVIPDPEYYDVVLTDGSSADDTTILLSIMWMRALRDPLLIMAVLAGLAFVIVLVLVLYRRRQAARQMTATGRAGGVF